MVVPLVVVGSTHRKSPIEGLVILPNQKARVMARISTYYQNNFQTLIEDWVAEKERESETVLIMKTFSAHKASLVFSIFFGIFF